MMRLSQKLFRKVEIERHNGVNQVKVFLPAKTGATEAPRQK